MVSKLKGRLRSRTRAAFVTTQNKKYRFDFTSVETYVSASTLPYAGWSQAITKPEDPVRWC